MLRMFLHRISSAPLRYASDTLAACGVAGSIAGKFGSVPIYGPSFRPMRCCTLGFASPLVGVMDIAAKGVPPLLALFVVCWLGALG